MACKPQYKGKRYNSLEELYKANGVNPQQKQQAQQLYSEYLESLNKPNTNPILQDNQQEQIKKFKELQERLNNKEFIEGAKNSYESSKELQQFGTQEQYNDYIARVSLGIIKNPSSGEYNYTSKVKDIVYHGGKINKESFKRFVDKTAYENRNPNSILGFFFSSSKNIVASQYAEKDYDAIEDQLTGDAETDAFIRRSAPLKKGSVSEELLDIKKPYIIQADEWENETWVDKLNILTEKDEDNNWDSDYKWTVDAYEKVKNHLQSLGYDGLYINSDKNLYNKTGIVDYITVQKVVFEPEQIHILGSKQDIEGFKSWVDGNQSNVLYQLPQGREIEEFVASEKTIRDLAARVSDRKGNQEAVITPNDNQELLYKLNDIFEDRTSLIFNINNNKDFDTNSRLKAIRSLIDNKEVNYNNHLEHLEEYLELFEHLPAIHNLINKYGSKQAILEVYNNDNGSGNNNLQQEFIEAVNGLKSIFRNVNKTKLNSLENWLDKNIVDINKIDIQDKDDNVLYPTEQYSLDVNNEKFIKYYYELSGKKEDIITFAKRLKSTIATYKLLGYNNDKILEMLKCL